MKRCHLSLRRVFLPILAALALLWQAPIVHAQAVRQFPQGARAGMLVVSTPPQASIDGAEIRLAPGVRIQGPDNMQLMSAALAGRSLAVAYLRDSYGLVSRIWVLNAAEVEAVRDSLAPAVNFRFDSTGGSAKVDDGKTPFHELPKYPVRKP